MGKLLFWILKFIFDNFYIISIILTLIGIFFCAFALYAFLKQRENRGEMRNVLIKPGANITNINYPNNNINYPNNKKKKSTGIMMGVGISFISAGILLAIIVPLLIFLGIILCIILLLIFYKMFTYFLEHMD